MRSETQVREPAGKVDHLLFKCSWERAVFLHYRVDPGILQKQIPFELDLWNDQAYVSLVAFTLRDLRINHPRFGWLTHPFHTHDFLNLRTYVRHDEGKGIYFLAEWLNNRVASMLGPILYGLPYRFAELNYHHDPRVSSIDGQVRAHRDILRYHATLPAAPHYEPCEPNSLDHFLLERYIAFTKLGPFRRLFRVAHNPWPQTPIAAQIEDDTLLGSTGPWFTQADFTHAHFSPGLSNIQMGGPQRLFAR